MNKKLYRTVAYAIAIMASASYSSIALAADSENANVPVVTADTAMELTTATTTGEVPATPVSTDISATTGEPLKTPNLDNEAKPNLDVPTGEPLPTTTMDGEAKPSLTAEEETPSPQEQAEHWTANRPDEDTIENRIAEYEGLTVVDIEFKGAGDLTRETAKRSLIMRAGDTYSAKSLMNDRDNIYNTGYFYDLYPTFEKIPEGVVITYHVLENPVLLDIKVTGNTVIDTADIFKLITVRKGEILNSRYLQENIQAIQEKYREKGYILAKISDLNIDRDGYLTIKINEGILEGYSVKGNTKTREKVILREMRQKPGTPFNATVARRSMQRLYNLGFFEDVNLKMNPGVEPNAVIMEIEVKEKRTGSFGLGAGYSSADGVVGMISVNDTNFMGMGDSIGISYEKSGEDDDAKGYTFFYSRPWLDSKETAATLRLYNRTYEFDDYDNDGNLNETYMRKYSGGEITVSRPMSEYSTNYITFKNRKEHYVRHEASGKYGDRGTPAFADWRKNNFGTTRSFILEHVTDTRDNIYDPTTGARAALSVELAGMGGDFSFQKYTISDNHYFKVGRAHVLALRAQYGYGTGSIPEFSQYRIGGQDTLRGYREEQFRGNKMALGTVEYRFPLMSKMQGAVFADWGATWNNGITPENGKGSIGIGVSFNTPIGPLRLDYGRGSQGGRVHFRVGGTF